MKIRDSHQKGTNKVIYINDLQLHSRQRVTPSIGKKIQKAFQTGDSDRLYFPLLKPSATEKGTQTFKFSIDLDPDTLKMIKEEEAKGNTISFALPPGGAPVFLGEDAIQFIQSKNGERIMRKLDNKNNENKL